MSPSPAAAAAVAAAADDADVTGLVALEEDVDGLAAELLSGYRRDRGGKAPFGVAQRVKRFLRCLREA